MSVVAIAGCRDEPSVGEVRDWFEHAYPEVTWSEISCSETGPDNPHDTSCSAVFKWDYSRPAADLFEFLADVNDRVAAGAPANFNGIIDLHPKLELRKDGSTLTKWTCSKSTYRPSSTITPGYPAQSVGLRADAARVRVHNCYYTWEKRK